MKLFSFLRRDPEPVATGKHLLDEHFGMSRANFICIPRVILNNMPDNWQVRMADLLQECANEYPNQPNDFIVRGKGRGGRMGKLSEAVTNYRHPDFDVLCAWHHDREPANVNAFTECIMIELPDYITRSQVSEYLSDLGHHYGDRDFCWDREAAKTLAKEIEEAFGE